MQEIHKINPTISYLDQKAVYFSPHLHFLIENGYFQPLYLINIRMTNLEVVPDTNKGIKNEEWILMYNNVAVPCKLL